MTSSYLHFLTWKTVITALQKESKLLRGIWSSSILNLTGNKESRNKSCHMLLNRKQTTSKSLLSPRVSRVLGLSRANLVLRVHDPFGLRQGSRRMVSADQSNHGLWEQFLPRETSARPKTRLCTKIASAKWWFWKQSDVLLLARLLSLLLFLSLEY